MVKLKNIVIEETTIKCDIYPEDSVVPGRIVVNTDSGELIKFDLPDKYEWCRNHVRHAQTKLVSLYKHKKIPQSEVVVMWN